MGAGRGAVTPDRLLAAYPDRTRPFVTHYAGPGSRVELSVASVGNAVAKASGMLRDGLGVGPGARLSVDLPRHWQLPVWTFAALCVGATCGRLLADRVDVRVVGPEALAGLRSGAPPAADEILVSSCDTFGMPVAGGVPAGVLDVGVDVRSYPDTFAPEPAAGPSARLVVAGAAPEGEVIAWPGLVDSARRATGPASAARGVRLWVDEHTPDDQLLLAAAVEPLLWQGSVVIATGLTAEQAGRVRSIEGASAQRSPIPSAAGPGA